MNQPAELIDSPAVNAGSSFTGRRRAAHSDDVDTGRRRRPELGGSQLAGRHEADPSGAGSLCKNGNHAPIHKGGEIARLLIVGVDQEIRELSVKGVLKNLPWLWRPGLLPIGVGHRDEISLSLTSLAHQGACLVKQLAPARLTETTESELVEYDARLMLQLPALPSKPELTESGAHGSLTVYSLDHRLPSGGWSLAQGALPGLLDIDNVGSSLERLDSLRS